jgi:hypothetical protein
MAASVPLTVHACASADSPRKNSSSSGGTLSVAGSLADREARARVVRGRLCSAAHVRGPSGGSERGSRPGGRDSGDTVPGRALSLRAPATVGECVRRTTEGGRIEGRMLAVSSSVVARISRRRPDVHGCR